MHSEGLKNVIGRVCHVSNREHREALIDMAVKEFGGIDILVSNAATNPAIGGILDAEEEAFDKIFDVNVKAAWLLTKEVVPHMNKRG